jgi:ABC-type bacteriocin/lantibiotic exporter with double-glycine peptidase domain
MESAMMARTLALPPDFFKERQAGDVAKRVMGVANIVDILVRIFIESGLTAMFSLVYVTQVAAFTPSLVVPALLVIAVQAIVSVAVALAKMRRQREIMRADLAV